MWNLHGLIDRAGSWNAQFFREIKGRCTPINLLGVFVVSGLMQLLVVMAAWVRADDPINTDNHLEIHWDKIWGYIFQDLTWFLPLVLVTVGTYFLASDLDRENRRGTLNFIRLSPQSGLSIMGGKFLGVPILVYLFVLCAAPLQLWAGFHSSSMGFFNTLLWDGFVLSVCGLFLLLTVFWMTLLPIRPIAMTALNLFLSSFFVNIFSYLLVFAEGRDGRFQDSDYLRWFYIPLNNIPTFCLWGIGTVLIAIYWLWEPIDRRYRNHHSTLLSKKSSYQLNFCCQLWLIGFVLTSLHKPSPELPSFLVTVGILQIVGAWSYFSILTPSRRILQDWSRYRRERVDGKWRWGSADLFRDLLWDDRSPASLAIAVNLLICSVPWLPFVWQASSPDQLHGFVSILLGAIVMFNYGTLFQILAARNNYTILGVNIFSIFWATVLGMLGAILTMLTIAGYTSLVATLLAGLTPLAILNLTAVPTWGLLLLAIGHLLLGWLWLSGFQKQVSLLGRSPSAAAAG
jgi:hypothetical protein